LTGGAYSTDLLKSSRESKEVWAEYYLGISTDNVSIHTRSLFAAMHVCSTDSRGRIKQTRGYLR
jgi:hypothetical protein